MTKLEWTVGSDDLLRGIGGLQPGCEHRDELVGHVALNQRRFVPI
jgi:hypothetical protein